MMKGLRINLFVFSVVAAAAMGGCAASDVGSAQTTRLHSAAPVKSYFEGNSQGGSTINFQTTRSFGVSKVNIGGNYEKSRATSPSFQVTGGVRNGS